MSNGIAITGASGFVGRHVVARLAGSGIGPIVALGRSNAPPSLPDETEWRRVPDYGGSSGFAEALEGCGTIIHLADAADRGEVRGLGAAPLIQSLQAAGVARAILASSVYARLSDEGHSSAYGARKRVSEQAFESTPGLSTIALRMPPVYGPGGKGGFNTLVKLVQRGVPLPLKNARATRDYLSVSNAADLLVALLVSWPEGVFTFVEPSDGLPISTADLATQIGAALGKPARLFPANAALLTAVGKLTGRAEQVEALLSPLHVAQSSDDIDALCGWRPARTLPETLDFLNKP